MVLGGTALGGGRGSVIATAGGVLFLSQLEQVIAALGATTAVDYIIQGAIVALGMGLRNVPWSRVSRPPRPGSGRRPRGGPGFTELGTRPARLTEPGPGRPNRERHRVAPRACQSKHRGGLNRCQLDLDARG